MDEGERRRRESHINARAFDLATSGMHISPLTIVSQLVAEGYPEAAHILSTKLIRDDLRRLCLEHWKGERRIQPARRK